MLVCLSFRIFKKKFVIGFDISKKRVNELKSGIDKNLEFDRKIKNLYKIIFYNNSNELKSANCFIVTVPTPINKSKKPNLRPLLNATKIIANIIKKMTLLFMSPHLSRMYRGGMCSCFRKIF